MVLQGQCPVSLINILGQAAHPPLGPPISILTDDVLLKIFDFCRLHDPREWRRGWWYRLIHTCRQWRYIVLESPSSLHLQLYCTYGTPVAEMFKHSPAFPLNISYNGEHPMSAEDEESALLALQHRDRVRLIDISEPGLQKLFTVMDKPFPMLEGLRLASPDLSRHSRLAQTFTAPHLRHLELVRVGDITTSRLHLLASITGLVTLTLEGIPASTILPVEYLMSRLSLMPQLEYRHLNFVARTASDRVRRELSDPTTPPVSFPNLYEIVFTGAISYLEMLAARILVPHLTRFTATLFYQSFFHLSFLSELLVAAKELRFPVTFVKFMDPGDDPPEASIHMAGSDQTLGQSPENAPFRISLKYPPLDRQVVLMGGVCTALTPMLSTVERLHVNGYATRERWPPPEIKRAMWHNLLRPFRNVEQLRVDDALVEDLSLALCPDDGPSMEILPELSKLAWPDFTHGGNSFDGFIAARKAAGRPIAKCLLISASDDEDLDNK